MNIKLKNIHKSYGSKVIFDNYNMELEENKITALMGPSGSGKTTLANILAGLTPYKGEVTGVTKVSYIFQESRLLPNLTVQDNLDYVLKREIKNSEERKKIIEDILTKVKLIEYKNYYPDELSGGMAQRVSIARAFIYPSSLLIMDEPFKELDEKLKEQVINEFIELHKSSPRTVLFITHDKTEATRLASKIINL